MVIEDVGSLLVVKRIDISSDSKLSIFLIVTVSDVYDNCDYTHNTYLLRHFAQETN